MRHNRNRKTLECSSSGDTRFSAYYARIKLPHAGRTLNKSIEEWYQLSKRFGRTKPTEVSDAKGKNPTHLIIDGKRYPAHFLTQWYKLLWLKYLDENPDLVKFASRYDEFTDKFRGRRSVNCQADLVKQYVKQGRQSIINECEYLLDMMEGWDLFMAKRPVSNLPVVTAWTDGACSFNGAENAIGGWAYIVTHDTHECVRSHAQKEKHTTNNKMELRAVIEIFKRLRVPCEITIYTDSEYVERPFSEGRLKRWMESNWRIKNGKEVANKELWQELTNAIKDGQHHVRVIRRDEKSDSNIMRCHKMATSAVSMINVKKPVRKKPSRRSA